MSVGSQEGWPESGKQEVSETEFIRYTGVSLVGTALYHLNTFCSLTANAEDLERQVGWSASWGRAVHWQTTQC